MRILLFKNSGLKIRNGGEGGIRTHGTVTRTLDFESSPFGQLRHLSDEVVFMFRIRDSHPARTSSLGREA